MVAFQRFPMLLAVTLYTTRVSCVSGGAMFVEGLTSVAWVVVCIPEHPGVGGFGGAFDILLDTTGSDGMIPLTAATKDRVAVKKALPLVVYTWS